MTFKIGKYKFKIAPIILKALYDKIVIRRKNLETKISDKIIIRGEVWFKNGGKETRHFRNHFVLQGLVGFINSYVFGGTNFSPTYNWVTSPFTNATMTLGTNTATPTTASMTSLVTPIGSGIGTVPNSQAGATGSTSTSAWVLLTSTWNAGTISGTVGEVGLWLFAMTTFLAFAGTLNPVARTFSSRLSVADGDFTAQTINASYAFTANWQLTASYA